MGFVFYNGAGTFETIFVPQAISVVARVQLGLGTDTALNGEQSSDMQPVGRPERPGGRDSRFLYGVLSVALWSQLAGSHTVSPESYLMLSSFLHDLCSLSFSLVLAQTVNNSRFTYQLVNYFAGG
jgi:hypothetical protein